MPFAPILLPIGAFALLLALLGKDAEAHEDDLKKEELNPDLVNDVKNAVASKDPAMLNAAADKAQAAGANKTADILRGQARADKLPQVTPTGKLPEVKPTKGKGSSKKGKQGSDYDSESVLASAQLEAKKLSDKHERENLLAQVKAEKEEKDAADKVRRQMEKAKHDSEKDAIADQYKAERDARNEKRDAEKAERNARQKEQKSKLQAAKDEADAQRKLAKKKADAERDLELKNREKELKEQKRAHDKDIDDARKLSEKEKDAAKKLKQQQIDDAAKRAKAEYEAKKATLPEVVPTRSDSTKLQKEQPKGSKLTETTLVEKPLPTPVKVDDNKFPSPGKPDKKTASKADEPKKTITAKRAEEIVTESKNIFDSDELFRKAQILSDGGYVKAGQAIFDRAADIEKKQKEYAKKTPEKGHDQPIIKDEKKKDAQGRAQVFPTGGKDRPPSDLKKVTPTSDIDKLMDKATEGTGSSPISDATDSQWVEFAKAMKMYPMTNITPAYRLGGFGIGMRRLEDLGYAKNVKQGDYKGHTAWLGDWNSPYSLKSFLNDPKLQYEAFKKSMAGRFNDIKKFDYKETFGHTIQGQKITLSGLLAVTHLAGIDGFKSWMKNKADRDKFPATTQAFLAANGKF